MSHKMLDPKRADKSAKSKAGPSVQGPSTQVTELERLQHAGVA